MKVYAWFGEPALKRAAIARLRAHRKLDELFQGQWWGDGSVFDEPRGGCMIGCLTHHGAQCPFEATEKMFGIPRAAAQALERTFEMSVDVDGAAEWAISSAEAIPVGADLFGVVSRVYGGEELIELLRSAPVVQGAQCPECVATAMAGMERDRAWVDNALVRA